MTSTSTFKSTSNTTALQDIFILEFVQRTVFEKYSYVFVRMMKAGLNVSTHYIAAIVPLYRREKLIAVLTSNPFANPLVAVTS